MGSFLKYLDCMEKNFNSSKDKENYIDDINEDNVETVYENEEVEDKEEVILETVVDSKFNNVYVKRLINELDNLGLNENKINEIVYNIFGGEIYENEYKVKRTQQPKSQSSFRQKMQQKKMAQKKESITEHASNILDGVPGGDENYTPNIIQSMPMNNQHITSQQHYIPPMQPQFTPPLPSVGGMVEINDNVNGGVGSVNASVPQPLLKMPEGFEGYTPKDDGNLTLQKAANILSEPNGEHVGQGVVVPQQIAMPIPPPLPSQQVHPQQAQEILAEPGNEHINSVSDVGISNVTNHASQLL